MPPVLIRRLKQHLVSLPDTGVDVILGTNGNVWISSELLLLLRAACALHVSCSVVVVVVVVVGCYALLCVLICKLVCYCSVFGGHVLFLFFVFCFLSIS